MGNTPDAEKPEHGIQKAAGANLVLKRELWIEYAILLLLWIRRKYIGSFSPLLLR